MYVVKCTENRDSWVYFNAWVYADAWRSQYPAYPAPTLNLERSYA